MWCTLSEPLLNTLLHFYREHGEHALANVEGVSPVVVEHHPVVFPDSQQPSAQCLQGEDEQRQR